MAVNVYAKVGYRGWVIEDTPCWPCRYKVYQPGCRSDNATWRYHKDLIGARSCIDSFVDSGKIEEV